MRAETETFVAEIRHRLSRRIIERTVEILGTKAIFNESQSWDGYDRACESWDVAFWKWVDDQAPAGLIENLQGLQIDWSRLSSFDWSLVPCVEELKKSWLLEQARQEYITQFALFKLAMQGPEATDAQTYPLFIDDMKSAAQIKDDSYFKAIAKQKHRKPSKGIGDRRLKYQLLFCEIAGCLWSLTKEGMAHFLDQHYPRSGNKLYDDKTIADARRNLKLYRPTTPLWWGIAGNPPTLQPLNKGRKSRSINSFHKSQ